MFFGEDKSLTERFTMYKDSLKIIKNNILLGTGGRGWLYNYKDVRSYDYTVSEIHSYILQLIIDNGIFAGMLWLIIVIYALVQILKRVKNNNIRATDFAFILLTLHSLLDFDLSFYVILVIWYILYSIVIKKENDKVDFSIKSNSAKVFIIILFILIQSFEIFMGVKYFYIEKKDEYYRQENINLLDKNNIWEQFKLKN